jgi:hypothetical protein
MLQCFSMAFQVFSGVFASVLDVCFKYVICHQTYVTNVSHVSKTDQVLLLENHLPQQASGQGGVERARVVSVWGQEVQATFGRHRPPHGRTKRSAGTGV